MVNMDPLVNRSELNLKIARLNRRIEEITTQGGEPNLINSIQRNGQTLQINNKAVNITVPVKTSDLTNDSGFVNDLSGYAKTTDLSNYVPVTALNSYYTKTEIDSMIGDIETLLGAI